MPRCRPSRVSQVTARRSTLDGDAPRASSQRGPMSRGDVRPLSGGFEYVLQPGEVGLHEPRVPCEVLVADVREPTQAEYHLTAVTVGDDSHRVVDDFA